MNTPGWMKRAARLLRGKHAETIARIKAMSPAEQRSLQLRFALSEASPKTPKKSPHPPLDPGHLSEPVEICPVGMAVIYALVDPDDSTVRYVGKSIRPGDRLDSHCESPHANKRLRDWIQRLRKGRKRPELHAIDLVLLVDWPEAERKWIAFYRKRGQIFNIEDGGPSRPRPGRANIPRRQPEVRVVPLPDEQRVAEEARGAGRVRDASGTHRPAGDVGPSERVLPELDNEAHGPPKPLDPVR